MIRSAALQLRSSNRYKWYALAAVMLGTFIAPLDGSVVNVALPSIANSYHTAIDATQWVLLSYLLIAASSLVLFGRLGDMIGQKTIYVLGFCVFGLASLGCSFAPSLAILIGSRCIQGVGAAMLMACTPALVTHIFPPNERGRALGLNGGVVATAVACGPVLGGVIVTYAKWPWVFLINIPIAIVALVMALFILKREKHTERERFDIVGALLVSTSLFAVSLALSRAHIWGWASPLTLGCFAYAVISLVSFLAWERRAVAPVLDLSLFENRTFSFSVIASMLYFCALFALVFILPLVAQSELGSSGLQAGLLLFPVFALNIVLAPIAGRLSDRIPARYISTLGALVFALGLIVLGLLPAHPSAGVLTLALILSGAGTAVFAQPNNNSIMGNAPPERRGIASGMLATARTTGQLLGIAIGGAIYFARIHQLGLLAHSYAPAQAVFLTSAGIMLIVAAISYARD